MKKVLLLSFTYLSLAFLPKVGFAEPTEVIIFAGQSNMMGHAREKNAPVGLFPRPGNIEFHNFSWYANLTPTLGRFGPEASFGATLANKNPDKPYIFIKWTVGGTSQENWSPKPATERLSLRNDLYRRAITDIRGILKDRAVKVTGIIWMQGEFDSRRKSSAEKYKKNITRLMTAFRKDLSAPNARVLVGLINPTAPQYTHVEVVREQMRAYTESDPLADWVSTDGLQKLPDGIHYDHVGQIALGERFASKWLQNL